MADHLKLGKQGEDLAAQWLQDKGYAIIHRNWQYFQNEIDIIATKGKFLHFIEVKTRKFTPFGNPEDNVTKTKFRHLMRAANNYLRIHPGHDWIQYDILSI